MTATAPRSTATVADVPSGARRAFAALIASITVPVTKEFSIRNWIAVSPKIMRVSRLGESGADPDDDCTGYTVSHAGALPAGQRPIQHALRGRPKT